MPDLADADSKPPLLLASVRRYRRAWLAGDLAAAAVLFVIAVPEQLATSRLAGMPPVTGLYAFIAGTAAFALLGANPCLSIGADSTIAPLFAVGVARFAAEGSHRYTELVAILAVMVGLILALVWLLRLGWVAEFLSVPIVTGFLAGIAVVIVAHELPDLLGLPVASSGTVSRIGSVLRHLGRVRPATLAIGAGTFALVSALERLDRRIPAALIALFASPLLVSVLSLRRHGVVVLGTVAHGPPTLGLSGVSVTSLAHLAPVAGFVALVVVTQAAATTRAFAPATGPPGDLNRDLLGIGAGSVVAGLAGAFPVNASPPRTAAVVESSGRTQLSGLLAAAAVAATVPALGLLRDLPLATLAGVLVFIAGRIFHGRKLMEIARFDLVEAALALITLGTVALVGVEPGIGVAVGLAILDRTRRSARPQLHVLGRIPGTTSWAPLSVVAGAQPVPGVLVVMFATPLWYANAPHFQAQLHASLRRVRGQPRLLVLDAVGMGDIDYTGSETLRAVLDELDRAEVRVALARAGHRVLEGLRRSGLLDRIGEDHVFAAVNEAVAGLAPPAGAEKGGQTLRRPL